MTRRGNKLTQASGELDFFCMIGPARQFAADQRFKHVDAFAEIVEARDIGKVDFARVQEAFLALNRQFFKRFEAVCGKAGREYRHLALALACQSFQRAISRGLEPFRPSEARLECRRKFATQFFDSSRAVFWHWQ